MYDTFYNKLKKAYGPSTRLLYSDTDSFLIRISFLHSFLEGINHPNLKGYVDTSNFPKDHPFFSEKFKGKFGAIKSETKHHPILEFIGLSPKCYSVLLSDGTVKSTSKGINKSQQKSLTHERYRQMLYHQQNLKIPCVNIVSKKMALHTICTNKNGLSLIDRKRYWYEDNTSHGFGYHKLPKISPSNNSLIPSKNRPSHNINHILPFSMNYRRGMNKVFESEHPKSGLYHIDK